MIRTVHNGDEIMSLETYNRCRDRVLYAALRSALEDQGLSQGQREAVASRLQQELQTSEWPFVPTYAGVV